MGDNENTRQADIEYLSRYNGLYVGLLSNDELAAFDRLCVAGLARREYSGAGALLGLAKVRVSP